MTAMFRQLAAPEGVPGLTGTKGVFLKVRLTC